MLPFEVYLTAEFVDHFILTAYTDDTFRMDAHLLVFPFWIKVA